ncbi:protein-glutamate O-methyltransferase CheR [Candidatus Lokiarchaeum ossiferum]|uniref:protein-glutamate O-methyltransferase CheR n=1 Tax=Candidatus Lokiarchaeum ossiferum TaxID=2951803 RepID=UPI00352E75AE
MDAEAKKRLIERSFKEIEEKKALFDRNPENSTQYFEKLKDLITFEGNLDLSNYRKKYLERRFLHRLSFLNIESYKKYIDFAKDNPKEILEMKDSLTIHTTEWFRDKTPFELLRKNILPRILKTKKLAADKTLRIFSAPCSSGQEPYTLAIILDDIRRELGITTPIEIYGCDVEPKIVEKAKDGKYYAQYMKGIPAEFVDRYFTPLPDDWFEIKHSIKRMVKFFVQNLFKPLPSWIKSMDVILCRNLLIYIDRDHQLQVIQNLSKILRKNGYLMLGKTESLLILNTKTDFIAENAREHLYQYTP